MYLLALVVLITSLSGCLGQDPPMDFCPPADPHCHPWCIKYDNYKCRLCMCDKDGGKLYSSGSNMHNTNADWEQLASASSSSSSSLSSSSSSNGWGDTSGSNSNHGDSTGLGSNNWGDTSNSESFGTTGKNGGEKIKYIIVESKPETHQNLQGLSPFQAFRGPSPFSASISSAFSSGPGSGPGGRPDPFPSVPNGYHVINVPVSAHPGVPQFCVRDRIMCPVHCLKVDIEGCFSCPCAPDEKPTKEADAAKCIGTLLCMIKCKDGYHLGDTGRDGCPSCTCLLPEQTTTTTPAPQRDCIEKAIACMLSCSQDHKTYKIEKSRNGECPQCKCEGVDNKEPGSHSASHASGGSHTFGESQTSGGSHTSGESQTSGGSHTHPTGNGSGNNNGGSGNDWLQSPSNGVANGGCPGPMCPGTDTGSGSFGGSTSMSSMSEMPKECKPPLSYVNCKGLGPSVPDSHSSANGHDSGCAGPFCASGNGAGGSGTSGGSGSSVSGSGTGSSSTSCSGPFCSGSGGSGGMMGGGGGSGAMMGGGGGSGGMMGGGGRSGGMMGGGGGGGMMGGGASTGGMSGSPFMAAMGGKVSSGIGGMSGGSGLAGSPFGMAAGMGRRGPIVDHKIEVDSNDCPELLECLLRCDNPVFDTSSLGCPGCHCP